MQLDKIFGEKNKILEFLIQYNNNRDRPVFLYGAGNGLVWYIKLLKKYNIPIAGIMESSEMDCEKGRRYGVPVRSLKAVCADIDQAIIVISAPAHRREISETVKKMAPEFYLVSFDPTLEVLQKISAKERIEYYKRKKDEIIHLWKSLQDEHSKITLEQVIKGAVTSDCNCYTDISSESQYFPEFLRKYMGEQEVFVDLGAFVGDSIQEFIDIVHDKYDRVYGFEPDEKNISVAVERLKDDRIRLFQRGVGAENTKMYFRNECGDVDGGAHVVENGMEATNKIEIVRLDDSINEKITFLKMDIEGMELDALRGSERLIRNYKPKLAISVYHKMEDILEIPAYLLALNLDYKLYLRHYWACSGTDTILFAL